MNQYIAGVNPAKERDQCAVWIDVGDTRLAASLELHRAPAILAIHELGGSRDSWIECRERLGGAVRWLAYDQRGQGESEPLSAPYDLTRQVIDAGAVLDAAEVSEPVWLIAAAAGCAVAVSYAARHPLRVAGLILCAPALGADAARRRYLTGRAQLAETAGMSAVVDASLAQAWPAALRRDAQAFTAYRQRMLAADAKGYALANRALADSDARQQVSRVACPCLLLAGAHDVLRPADGVAALARDFRHARFAAIDAAHLLAVQAPQALARHILDFIDETDR